ncbi:hypothetical protein [Enterobacter asburiae]|uniref:hypothetical protein n=1 Tax=Enterobacter asburiae TaxID=61645 RepID=UPI0021D1F406|nr:hypothetical protein [Enterobacter asburiae]MCU6243871.1 hypothetical protein [Enterobacter asburiae]
MIAVREPDADFIRKRLIRFNNHNCQRFGVIKGIHKVPLWLVDSYAAHFLVEGGVAKIPQRAPDTQKTSTRLKAQPYK